MEAIYEPHRPPALLPHVLVGELSPEDSSRRWLIEDLWGACDVGFLYSLPKHGKSWMGLDIAVSVASGTPCLGRFAVHDRGPVVVYLAEDKPASLRERVEGIARHRRLAISELEVHVITVPSLKIDSRRDRSRLSATLSELRPRLLVLDPLVRLHNLNENDSQAISELLSYLRELQRSFDLAVLLVHHARKGGGGAIQGGEGLRGSGDLWAWSDTNLFLRRLRGNLQLSTEHRSAPSPDPLYLKLETNDPARIHLEVTEEKVRQKNDSTLCESVIDALGAEGEITRQALRQRLCVRNERLGHVLELLETEGRVERSQRGWRLISS
jgi:hypothetical protein